MLRLYIFCHLPEVSEYGIALNPFQNRFWARFPAVGQAGASLALTP
ncbi:MAG: hypothetical protein MUE85_23235 [Microscillaceae bacterium]|nr:hypothetical protein [Microscillaceae bacterium]